MFLAPRVGGAGLCCRRTDPLALPFDKYSQHTGKRKKYEEVSKSIPPGWMEGVIL